MKQNYSILSGYVDPNMLKHSSHSSNSTLSGYVVPNTLNHNIVNNHNNSSNYVSSQSKSLFVSSTSNSINHTKTIISNDNSSSYLSSIKYTQDAEAFHSYQEVTSKAKSIDEEIKIITNSILRIGQHKDNVFNAGNDLCKKMAQHYLHEAEYNNCAYQKSRDEWKVKGNLYLTSNIYDIMKEYNILPSWAEQYLTPLENNQEEEELMKVQIEELKEQLKLLSLEKEQKDNALAEKDNALAEKDEIILQLQTENHDLTEKLSVSEENNTILQNKLDISETKIISLQEKVVDLKHHNEQLENDKVELREDKKMLIEDKKMIQEEKNLLLVDKKFFQDLNITKENELTELKHIHFDTEHCTIVGHCNNPNHDEI